MSWGMFPLCPVVEISHKFVERWFAIINSTINSIESTLNYQLNT